MARIREKIKKGNPYYYLVESRRTGPNHSPREIILEYIGTPRNLMDFTNAQIQRLQAIENSTPSLPQNMTYKSYAHGAVMGLFWAAQSIGLEEIFDTVFPPKTIKGLPRSRVLLLSMIQFSPQSSLRRFIFNLTRSPWTPLPSGKQWTESARSKSKRYGIRS